MVTYKKPLSVGQVAAICRVSKKTVLNWIYDGALKAFTTYGGHYRLWPANIKKFLDSAGMDIPFDFVDDRTTHVLIIDDDLDYSQILKSAIVAELPGVEVVSTDDGYEGLLLIGEIKPQLVILDIKMPKVDGFQVLDLLRARRKDNTMKVIVMSAYLDSETRARLKLTVADGLWEKGMSVTEILRSLDEIVNAEEQSKAKVRPRLKSKPYTAAHAD